MYEIHIIRDKNHRDTGCRIDKESYEKYGTSVLMSQHKNEIHIEFTNPVQEPSGMIGYTGSTASYTGIEQILREKCLFTNPKYERCFLDNPLKEFFPHRYSWTLPETEIVKIAAQHDVKLVFEDQLSLKTDFLNPANALDVTFINGNYDAADNAYEYTFIHDYEEWKASQERVKEIEAHRNDYPNSVDYSRAIAIASTSIRPEDYDAGQRITQALFALGCNSGWECWNITYPHAIDDKFIKRAKTEHNMNITVK